MIRFIRMGMKDFKVKIKESLDSLDFYNDPKHLKKEKNLKQWRLQQML